MQYLGGKSRIAKPLAAYLESRREGRYFVEPFCGALNITVEMTGPRLASDASPYLFSLYRALREGWEPPDTVSEQLYAEVQARKDPEDPLTAFVGYGCSFGGKFFGGYARVSNPDTANRGRHPSPYANAARKTLLRKMARCSSVVFACEEYSALRPTKGCLVYCDPPYAGTTGYSAVGEFDSVAFWQWVRDTSARGVLVLVSEYKAPQDFTCVWEVSRPAELQGKDKQAGRVERLFEWSGR